MKLTQKQMILDLVKINNLIMDASLYWGKYEDELPILKKIRTLSFDAFNQMAENSFMDILNRE